MSRSKLSSIYQSDASPSIILQHIRTEHQPFPFVHVTILCISLTPYSILTFHYSECVFFPALHIIYPWPFNLLSTRTTYILPIRKRPPPFFPSPDNREHRFKRGGLEQPLLPKTQSHQSPSATIMSRWVRYTAERRALESLLPCNISLDNNQRTMKGTSSP